MELKKVLDYLKKLDKDIKGADAYHELEMCSDGSGIVKGVRGETVICFNDAEDFERQIDNDE